MLAPFSWSRWAHLRDGQMPILDCWRQPIPLIIGLLFLTLDGVAWGELYQGNQGTLGW